MICHRVIKRHDQICEPEEERRIAAARQPKRNALDQMRNVEAAETLFKNLEIGSAVRNTRLDGPASLGFVTHKDITEITVLFAAGSEKQWRGSYDIDFFVRNPGVITQLTKTRT